MLRALAVLALCTACPPRVEPPLRAPGSGDAPVVAPVPIDAPEPSQEERLAAIQKAMNELDEAAQACWAAAAVERFDIEGEIAATIEIQGAGSAKISVARDTTRTPRLAACLGQLLAQYPWAPPLHGQAIQLPFKFRAPANGQNVIDRALVPWKGQDKLSLAVLLDENNSGNGAASMFELAIAKDGATGARRAERTELWYFLGSAQVTSGTPAKQAVAAGDMILIPAGAVRNIRAAAEDVHAVLVVVPGGREGAARAGALPTPEAAASGTKRIKLVTASAAQKHGPATIYIEPGTVRDTPLAASILELRAGAQVAEHVHANETEMLYVLAGSGTMTVAGVQLAITPTSVVQIPPATKHAFTATSDVRAVQIYTPAGPEQRFKAKP
jgi:quercetin dioxygenase-like cupin family protein